MSCQDCHNLNKSSISCLRFVYASEKFVKFSWLSYQLILSRSVFGWHSLSNPPFFSCVFDVSTFCLVDHHKDSIAIWWYTTSAKKRTTITNTCQLNEIWCREKENRIVDRWTLFQIQFNGFFFFKISKWGPRQSCCMGMQWKRQEGPAVFYFLSEYTSIHTTAPIPNYQMRG